MKIQIVALLLILSIGFSTATNTSQEIQKGKQLFRKLKNSSDIGRNLVETIALELSTSSGDQTVISRVVEMVKEIEQSLLDQQNDMKEEVTAKDEKCYVRVNELKEEISDLDERITDLTDKLPLRKDEFDLKQQEFKQKQEDLTFYQDETLKLDAKAAEKKSEYEESKEENNQLITALQNAKRLIKTLQPSFLQKQTAEASFAQVKNHFESAMKFMNFGHNKAFLRYLLQVTAQTQGEEVQTVLDIIDELIAATEDTQNIERKAEQARITLYQQKRESLKASITEVEGQLLQIQQEIGSAQTRYRETKESLESAQESRDSKQEQLDDQRQSCEDAVSGLNARIENFEEILDLIRQLLILLENSSIANVDTMMSDIEGDQPNSIEVESE